MKALTAKLKSSRRMLLFFIIPRKSILGRSGAFVSATAIHWVIIVWESECNFHKMPAIDPLPVSILHDGRSPIKESVRLLTIFCPSLISTLSNASWQSRLLRSFRTRPNVIEFSIKFNAPLFAARWALPRALLLVTWGKRGGWRRPDRVGRGA